jgi:hypothetical protein
MMITIVVFLAASVAFGIALVVRYRLALRRAQQQAELAEMEEHWANIRDMLDDGAE